MGTKAKKPKPIEAFIAWEDCLREDRNYGNLKILSRDGVIWEVTVYRAKGEVGFKTPRRRQNLSALKKDFGRDLKGMAATWRAMILNQEKGYELASPLFLEQIKKMLQ